MPETVARDPHAPGPSPASHRGRPRDAFTTPGRAPAGTIADVADEQQTPAGTVRTTAPTPATFRAVPTVALVAVAFFALCMSPIAFQGGPWFLVFLVPVALGFWVVRGRTRVDDDGLHVRGLVGSRSVAWADLSGLRLPEKGWVHAVPTEGSEVELRGVRIRDLGRVSEASGGRISAPTPAEAEAAAEHARELEAARMRVAKLRERQAEARAGTTASGDEAPADHDASAGTTADDEAPTTDADTDTDGPQRREA